MRLQYIICTVHAQRTNQIRRIAPIYILYTPNPCTTLHFCVNVALERPLPYPPRRTDLHLKADSFYSCAQEGITQARLRREGFEGPSQTVGFVTIIGQEDFARTSGFGFDRLNKSIRPVDENFPAYSCSVLSSGVPGSFREKIVDFLDNPVFVTVIKHSVRHLLAFDKKTAGQKSFCRRKS